jgi:prophage tail gpP-like protein
MSDDLTLKVSTCTRNTAAASGQPTYTLSNTRSLTGWTEVRVSRGIERCPSDFDVSFTEPYPAVSSVIVQPGDYVQVLLGADVVLTGFVDRYQPSYSANQHTIRISGRSLCQDLVDCSANWKGFQFLNTPLLQIAQALCGTYGIPVNLAAGADQGAPIPQLNVLIGESVHDVLERLCRFRALLLYDQPDGSLVLASAQAPGAPGAAAIGTGTAAGGLKEGVNVLEASAVYGMDGRFSDYDAVRQSLDTCQDVGDGGNLIASVQDTGVPRLRYRAIIAESVSGGQDVAQQRAQWEMNRRVGRSFQVRVMTDGWRDANGALYAPNTYVALDLPGLKLRPVTWLISDVTYKRDERGTTCELTILPPAAFLQEPIILNPFAPDVTAS